MPQRLSNRWEVSSIWHKNRLRNCNRIETWIKCTEHTPLVSVSKNRLRLKMWTRNTQMAKKTMIWTKKRKKCETFIIVQPTKSTTSKSKSVSWTIQITENLLECLSIFCINQSSLDNPHLCQKVARIIDFITIRLVWTLVNRLRNSRKKDCNLPGKNGNTARVTTWSSRNRNSNNLKRAMPVKYSSL